jgi:hypothetical protein
MISRSAPLSTRTTMNRRTKAFHARLLHWFAAMGRTLDGLPELERSDLWTWEKANIGPFKDLATSDWPGWQKYIGEKPVYSDPIRAIVSHPMTDRREEARHVSS